MHTHTDTLRNYKGRLELAAREPINEKYLDHNGLFRDTTFRRIRPFYGVLPPQSFTRAGKWPGFVSAHPTGSGVALPPKKN